MEVGTLASTCPLLLNPSNVPQQRYWAYNAYDIPSSVFFFFFFVFGDNNYVCTYEKGVASIHTVFPRLERVRSIN